MESHKKRLSRESREEGKWKMTKYGAGNSIERSEALSKN
jgi:hypothetical protein